MNKKERLVAAYDYLLHQRIVDSKADFARQLNRSRPPIINALNGDERYVTDKLLRCVAIVYSDIFDEDWLCYGTGTMLKANKIQFNQEQGSPYFDDFTIQGGYATGTGNEQAIVPSGYMQVPGIPVAEDIIYIKVKGESMVNPKDPSSSIPDGSMIAIRRQKSGVIRWGEIYAVMTTDGAIVKKLLPSEKQNCVKCVSLNEENGYLPFDLPTNEIISGQLYNVVGIVNIRVM